MTMPHTDVTSFLLEGKPPGRAAFLFVDKEYTYGEVKHSCYAVSRNLLARNVRRGDRVLLVSDNSFFWVSAYLGSLHAGLVCVPLPTSIGQEHLDHILRLTEARIAFVQSGCIAKYRHSLQGIDVITERSILEHAYHPTPGAPSTGPFMTEHGAHPPWNIHPDDVAAIMFTSGSTGEPRGVMISHANIMANTQSIIQYLELTDRDRIMVVLPFHYCFGTSLLHTHLKAGGSLVIDQRFMYPETVLERMRATECTGFAGVPSHFQILLRSSGLRKKRFPSLRYVQQAGGHLAPGFIQDLRNALPHTQIFIMYGQTEATARLSYLPPEFLDVKPGSIGKGIPGVTLRVLNESGQEIRPGEVGEIVAEGDNIAKGYWLSPRETHQCFRDGRLYTGDHATMDEDGFLYIVGRAKDFLKRGGTRISCRQIEEMLLGYEGLQEAAVIGVPDEILGEAARAFVVPCSGQTDGLEARLRSFCAQHIPRHHIPRDIIILQTLPRNSAGKVDKQQLKTFGSR